MANQLSPELLAQLYGQESGDPFLTLLTLDHNSLPEPIRLVNDTRNFVSRGNTYLALPFSLALPPDDGESAREINLELDNVSLDLISLVRNITDIIDVKIEMVLASIPDEVQYEVEELKIRSITYDASKITATLYLDNFLQTELSSEKYTPLTHPGLF
jgi:hypothetical protein